MKIIIQNENWKWKMKLIIQKWKWNSKNENENWEFLFKNEKIWQESYYFWIKNEKSIVILNPKKIKQVYLFRGKNFRQAKVFT